jgi:hypothetical protein
VHEPGDAAQVHRGMRQRGQKGAAAPCWRMGGRARRCSPVAVEEDESDEAVLEGCSPEHKQRRRGGAMEVKNGGGLSSA